MNTRSLFVIGVLLTHSLCSISSMAAEMIDGKFPVVSNLRAGVAKVDITPAEVEGITIVGHRRAVTGIRDPLRAGVLLLDDGETKAALVTLDTIGAWEDMVKLVRAGTSRRRASRHLISWWRLRTTTPGPGYEVNAGWGRELVSRVIAAGKTAAGNMRPAKVARGSGSETA
jgi:neutral ceramidase